MRFVDTAEGPADPIGEFVSAEQPLGLDHLSLAVNPFGLDGVEPRTLLGKQAGHYPHSAATIFDLAVVGGHPVTHLMAFMPAGVVPDQKQGILAPLFELLAAPLKKLRGYGAHRPTINEPQPGLFELGQIHPVASECLRLGVVLSRLLLQKTRRVCGIRPRECKLGRSKRENQVSSSNPKAHSGWASASRISRSRALFCGRIRDRGSRSTAWPARSAPPA